MMPSTLLSTAASITVVPGAASTSRTVPSGWMYVTRVIASCGRFWPLAGNPDLDEYPYSLCITLQASWAVIIAPIFVCRARLRSEEHTSELQSRENLVCRLLLEKKKTKHDSI